MRQGELEEGGEEIEEGEEEAEAGVVSLLVDVLLILGHRILTEWLVLAIQSVDRRGADANTHGFPKSRSRSVFVARKKMAPGARCLSIVLQLFCTINQQC